MSEHVWFSLRKPKQDAQMRLFCFPYAGGSASIYQSRVKEISVHDILAWKKHTGESFASPLFPGGHFFIHHARDELLKIMVQQLSLTLFWNVRDERSI